jgi:DNA-binding response OmpR family regulator
MHQMRENQTAEREFAGRHILVVEDEFLISDEIALAFAHLGVETIGAYTLEEGMELLESSAKVDGAVLDVNLQGKMVFPLADALQKRRVPFIFATGYDRDVIPERYQSVPCCEKPLDPKEVVQALFDVPTYP